MTSKVHIAVDGLGNPLRFILTGGQVGDVTQAEELIADVAGANLIADTAYEALPIISAPVSTMPE